MFESPQAAWARALQANATTNEQVETMIAQLEARGIARQRAIDLVVELLRCCTEGWRN
jgi:hypothetical protein